MKSNPLTNIIGEVDDQYILEAAPIDNAATTNKSNMLRWTKVAVLMIIIFLLGLGSYTLVSVAKEYRSVAKNKKAEIRYDYHYEFIKDDSLGFEIHDKSYFEKYNGKSLLWSISVSDFAISGYKPLSDGVIVYGSTYVWSGDQAVNAYIMKINSDGAILWQHMLDNGFNKEYINYILEKADGSYAVMGHGDNNYLSLSTYSASGNLLSSCKSKMDNPIVKLAIQCDAGYLIKLAGQSANSSNSVLKIDEKGSIIDSYSYEDDSYYYFINDMIDYKGKSYLSTNAVPKPSGEAQASVQVDETSQMIEEIIDKYGFEIKDDEFLPLIKSNYTATLLRWDTGTDKTQIFYTVKASLASELRIDSEGNLIWVTGNITAASFYPYANLFSVKGTYIQYNYIFNSSNDLVKEVETGEIKNFIK